MAIHRLLQKAVYGPTEIAAMTAAYENTLRALGLVDRRDPVTEIIAKKIIEIARTGERDPQRLSALAIEQLGIPIPPDAP
jgi:hypothetical protein